MKLLVIGSGGREHALAWKLAQSVNVEQVFVAPGNAGTADEALISNIDIQDISSLIQFCQTQQIDLTVVGPEAPLAQGIVDQFQEANLAIFGPTQYCAMLESSKDFAKSFMKQYHIPTAEYATFDSAEQAHSYLNQKQAPIVVKADGLASGKGVVVAMTIEEAHQTVDDMLLYGQMGQAGAKVVIEDFLEGEEASFIVMTDGEHILPMASSQDHKRLLNDDLGPNTGGMGAYSPAPIITPEVHDRIIKNIIKPTIQGIKNRGYRYCGFLYAGLMIDKNGMPFVVEYNCRFGDPETQPIMMRLNSDLVTLITQALSGNLDQAQAVWDDRSAVGVVVATKDYPYQSNKDQAIQGLTHGIQDESGKIFLAGVKKTTTGEYQTNGGRVLCSVGLGDTLAKAQEKAYQLLKQVYFNGMQYRTDIGYKALNKNELNKIYK